MIEASKQEISTATKELASKAGVKGSEIIPEKFYYKTEHLPFFNQLSEIISLEGGDFKNGRN